MRRLIGVFAAMCLSCSLFAQQPPAAPQKPQEPAKLQENVPYLVSQPVVQHYSETSFLYVTTQATQKTMPQVMKDLVPKLQQAMKASDVVPMNPMIIVYQNITPDPDALFDVEVGYQVADSTKAAGEAQVRKLQAFTCASVLYTGPMQQMAKPFETVFPAIMSAGKQPTMEIRQMIMYFEKEESPNNVSLIMAGIQ